MTEIYIEGDKLRDPFQFNKGAKLKAIKIKSSKLV
jgi:hypothetical protein